MSPTDLLLPGSVILTIDDPTLTDSKGLFGNKTSTGGSVLSGLAKRKAFWIVTGKHC